MLETFAGRFLLLRHLGQGGMGEVFLARDLTTGQECALKRLSPEVAKRLPDGARREFELLSRVRHPLLVQVFEFGVSPEGVPFCTMEYVPGVASDRAIARADWATLCYVGSQIALGLEFLHSAQVAHGDLKPANVLVVPAEVAGERPRSIRLLDFGLAGVFGEATGGHTGTPGFAAPEVVRGEPISAATDLYGLGATLYTIACGRPPFEAGDQDSLLRRQQAGPPSSLPLEEAGAPGGLVALILQLMAPEPRERPASAREVRAALGRLHPDARRSLSERLQATQVVGRERELARIERWLATADTARRLVILAGGAGTGKSAILTEVATRASLLGIDCVPLSCGATEGRGGIIQVLLKRMAARARLDLSSLVNPNLERALALEEPTLRDQDLDALSEAGVQCMTALAAESQRVLVLLDDTERIDPLSAAWARRLLCHPATAALRMIWARRAQGSEPNEQEATMIAADYADVISLGVLDRAAVERLAAARLIDVPGEVLVQFLWTRADGHPGLTVELLKAAASQGAIVDDDDGLRVDAARLERVSIPADFESSLAQRAGELPPGARAVLEALAVWGRALEAKALEILVPGVVASDADVLVGAGLARRLSGRELMLWPPAFAERLTASLPAERKQGLHQRALEIAGLTEADRFRHLSGLGRVAEALQAAEAVLTSSPDIDLARAAAALSLGGPVAEAEAATWCERVARLFINERRYAAAIPHLEKALELEREGATRGARWVALANCFLRAGRHEDVSRVTEMALSEGVSENERRRLQYTQAARLFHGADIPGAMTLAADTLKDAALVGDHESVAVCAEILVRGHLHAREVDEAERRAQQAEEAYEQAGNGPGRVRSIGMKGAIARVRHDLDAAERLYLRALDVARGQGNRLGIEETLIDLALCQADRGKWLAARNCYVEMLRLATEDSRGIGVAGATVNLGYIAGLTGDSTNATRFARRALGLVRAHRPRIQGFAWRSLAQAYRVAGRWRLALRAAHRAIALADRAMPEERIWSRLELGRIHTARMKWQVGADVWGAVAERLEEASPAENAIMRAYLGRAALRMGSRDKAAVEMSELRSWTASHESPYSAAHVRLLEAEIALQRGAENATELAAGALEAFTTLSAVPDRAVAALELARMTPPNPSNTSGAMRWLGVALQDFERLGNLRGRLQTLSLMVEWQKRVPAGGAPATTDRGLIERVSWLLNSISDLPQLAQRALKMAIDQLDAERGAVLLLDRETGQFRVIAEHGAMDAAARNEALGFSRRVVERVTESGGSLLISDAVTDPRVRSDSIMNLQLLSILCVPLFSGSTVMGAVYLDDSRRAHRFAEEDRGLLEGFAHLMAVAIDKARGHEETERFRRMLEEENLELRQEVGARFQYQNVIGTSSQMKRVLATVAHAARTSTTVLISGESGTGKELIARTLHHGGRQKAGPFRSVNCGAFTETLLESELFGILPNVATGVRERKGLFVQAHGGTLFLDEIGEMPVRQQVALLAALANREITPVGGSRPVPFDVRIIAATNRNLRQLVQEGRFREDLYYRLSVLEIEMPPLRDRKSDLPALAMHFLRHFSKSQEREVPELSPDFMAVLMQSDWPGNVRELQNYVERVLAVNPGRVLRPDPLPPDLQNRGVAHRPGRGRRLADTVGDIERRMLTDALQKAGGNQSEAARLLGLTEQSVRYRIRKYGMGPARAIRRTRQK